VTIFVLNITGFSRVKLYTRQSEVLKIINIFSMIGHFTGYHQVDDLLAIIFVANILTTYYE